MSDSVSSEVGDSDYVKLSIMGALKLYLDFINMFPVPSEDLRPPTLMINLPDFLNTSPTAFHAADTIVSELDAAGWIRLEERDSWKNESRRGCLMSSGTTDLSRPLPQGTGSHGIREYELLHPIWTAPLWKIKTEAITAEKGGWRDSCRSPTVRRSTAAGWIGSWEIAGIVVFSDGKGGIENRIWRSGRALAIIPSLALHFDREVNKGSELNIQDHMAALMPYSEKELPNDVLISMQQASPEEGLNGYPLYRRIAVDLDVDVKQILSAELFLVPREQASVLGDGRGRVDCLGTP